MKKLTLAVIIVHRSIQTNKEVLNHSQDVQKMIQKLCIKSFYNKQHIQLVWCRINLTIKAWKLLANQKNQANSYNNNNNNNNNNNINNNNNDSNINELNYFLYSMCILKIIAKFILFGAFLVFIFN